MMPIVKVSVDQQTYNQLVRLRKKEGLPSVSALFLKKAGVLTEEREASEIVTAAFKTLKRKESGFEFSLRDLFPSSRWRSFSKVGRLRAGKLFNAEVGTLRHGVKVGGKTASNHQLYVKV